MSENQKGTKLLKNINHYMSMTGIAQCGFFNDCSIPHEDSQTQ